jgi:tetratricopeptide (TPR) repeat protein
MEPTVPPQDPAAPEQPDAANETSGPPAHAAGNDAGDKGQAQDGGGKDNKTPPWIIAATVVVTAINGAIAFVGFNSAKAISEHENAAKAKLQAIQQVTERGYILYARAAERDFTELVAASPGIGLTGPTVQHAIATVKEDKESLDILEKEVPPEKRQPVRYLMEGYLQIVRGDCKEAITTLEKYPRDVALKYLMLASAHQLCGNRPKAIELNNRVKDLPVTRPADRIKAKALNNNGNAMMKDQKYDDAVDYYRRALKADGSLYGVHYNLAAAFSRLGQYDEAVRHLCRYKASHDANVADEVESDPDKDFDGLQKDLGAGWKGVLMTRLAACG